MISTSNDSLSGLPGVDSDVNGFFTNLLPGLGAFIIISIVMTGVSWIVSLIVKVLNGRTNEDDNNKLNEFDDIEPIKEKVYGIVKQNELPNKQVKRVEPVTDNEFDEVI